MNVVYRELRFGCLLQLATGDSSLFWLSVYLLNYVWLATVAKRIHIPIIVRNLAAVRWRNRIIHLDKNFMATAAHVSTMSVFQAIV